MSKLNIENGYEPGKKKRLFALAAITFAVSGALMSGCSSDSSSSRAVSTLPSVDEPPVLEITGTDLSCGVEETELAVFDPALEVEAPNSIPSFIASRDVVTNSELNGNAGNVLKRLSAVVPSQDTQGIPVEDPDTMLPFDVHPLLMSYAEQVIGPYGLGDGSADIGDPFQIDDMFVSISMDNGKTWKKEQVAKTSEKSSINVTWGQNALSTTYPGHSHKPTMEIQGDKILVAWNDKYCPSGNPFGLEQVDGTFPDDLYKVNGTQGSIDYGGIVAPNEKSLYEVPFSCVWTARGVFREDPVTPDVYAIEWRQAEQLTTGTRDSNKIWIAAADVGFALTWQEDTEGLRSGKGLGPGEGYSGATTNHGSDIWYTHITMDDFDNVCLDGVTDCDPTVVTEWTDVVADIAAFATKPKVSHNFTYPVRITNNEICAADDTKPYCTALGTNPADPGGDLIAVNCIATLTSETGSQGNSQTVERCVQADLDYMTPNSGVEPAAAVLDGDTGASRPALKILKTDADEYVAILAYEETKGLSESGGGDPDPGAFPNIALEGKGVYFESFLWDQPVTVSAGRLVNLRVPEVAITKDEVTNDVIIGAETGLDIYENARRVVIATQVDSCDTGDFTFGLLYKQGYDTQGGPSDMYIRMNTGFTYDTFEVDTEDAAVALNVSSHEAVLDVDGNDTGAIVWTEANMADQSYTFPDDNTFSPRILLRGQEIYTGFEYTPSWRKTEQGTIPNNFWTNRYVDDGDGLKWHGPQQVSIVTGAKTSTLDPRFITTEKGSFATSGLASDKSNPNVLFMSYGTFDMSTKEELDLFYTRSTDKGKTWEYLVDDGGIRAAELADYGPDGLPGTADDVNAVTLAKLAHSGGLPETVIEKEVQAMASPDGTLLFNAWLQETHDACLDPWCGLESRFGLVEYTFDPTPVP